MPSAEEFYLLDDLYGKPAKNRLISTVIAATYHVVRLMDLR